MIHVDTAPTCSTSTAALLLGITADAVRGRAVRGTIDAVWDNWNGKRGTWRISMIAVAELLKERDGVYRVPFNTACYQDSTVATAAEQAERLAIFQSQKPGRNPRAFVDAEGRMVESWVADRRTVLVRDTDYDEAQISKPTLPPCVY